MSFPTLGFNKPSWVAVKRPSGEWIPELRLICSYPSSWPFWEALQFRHLPPPSLFFHSLPLNTPPLFSVWGLASELQTGVSCCCLNLDGSDSPSPKQNLWSPAPPPPGPPQSVSTDSKAFHRLVAFKGLPCWVVKEKWEDVLSVEGDVS